MPGILETFEAKHALSGRLAARASETFPSGVTHDARAFAPWPVYVDRAQGPRKWDVDGNEYVDYIGGHGALLLGHNRPEVVEAIQAALARGTHFGSSHDIEVEWGQQVLNMVPCGERVRFTSSGTEATMMALRLARAYTGRERVIKLEEHFHGWHDIVVGRLRDDQAQPYSPGVPEGFYDSLTIVPAGDVEALRAALAPRDVAAVILEPTGAHFGTHPLAPSYLHTARAATEETGTIFVMDEVITGFRMAPGGAQERYGVNADLSTHAKIVAGGLPG
ncbi:MAG: aminotransferase class III-fold pyridoxal phosphate-dependent enzyme, partial [Dehalococcoidia bacterium]|nr:aminotransferase class III-fold pyridoxal phosphate-dependent enzyme [Dehalococcoidia bacterium]